MIHGHTSHAMILQMQEYRERVQSACQTTYQFSLQRPSKLSAQDERRRKTKGYCRARVLATTKQFFTPREPAPSHFSSPVGHGKERVLPRTSDCGHVKFHQMPARKDEFLFGDPRGGTARRPKLAHAGGSGGASGIAKDHFALGPGQYDTTSVRPSTSGGGGGASVKFSPSDRFHETFATDQLGPGQYLLSETLTSPRAAAAVFSQTPRQTEAALLVSPTANTVSSYYYVPASSFPDKNAPQCDRASWPRAPRLTSQRRTAASLKAQQRREAEANTTDFVAKNCAELAKQSAVIRLRRAREHQGRLPVRDESASDDDGDESDGFSAPVTLFKRRSSIFLDITDTIAQPPSAQQQSQSPVALAQPPALVRRVSSASTTLVKHVVSAAAVPECTLRGWVTLASIATFSVRLSRLYHLTTILRRIQRTETQHVTLVVFREWQKLDHARAVQYAQHVIVRNSLRLRLRLRIARKGAHAAILRQFLHGLSIDVQFAIAMKKIKRKIQLIQRWWRHVQLLVKAREEALYHKWVSVESRLRLEYISQMPHLHRIFQPPQTSGSTTTMLALSTGASRSSISMPSANSNSSSSSSTHESDTTLQKLLNLPEQKKWFTGQFVLTSDGCLRGYSSTDPTELVVEVKNYRCNFHDNVTALSDGERLDAALMMPNDTAAGNTAALQAYQSYSNARWKPFVMVFRQGAFRFVLLTSASPMPTEILSWKDKLERLVVTPASSGSSNGADAPHHRQPSVGDFVEVSMQSGILATHHHHQQHSLGSLALLTATSGSSSNHHNSSSGSIMLAAGSSSSALLSAAVTATAPSLSRSPASRGKLQARVRSIRQRNRTGFTVTEGELTYYVVDLLKDFPKVPTPVIWQTIREKLREKRKSFRAELYRYDLELFHYHRHEEQTKHIDVLDKFKEFFVRPGSCSERLIQVDTLLTWLVCVSVCRRSNDPSDRTFAVSSRTARWSSSFAR